MTSSIRQHEQVMSYVLVVETTRTTDVLRDTRTAISRRT